MPKLCYPFADPSDCISEWPGLLKSGKPKGKGRMGRCQSLLDPGCQSLTYISYIYMNACDERSKFLSDCQPKDFLTVFEEQQRWA